MAWLTGWDYRKKLHIDSSSDGQLTNYQKKITVNYGSGTDSGVDVFTSSHCATDFGDVRFTTSSGDTELDYYMIQKTDSDKAAFYVEIDNIPSSGGVDVYVYYGKSATATTSSGANTFPAFEDWESTPYSIDTDGTAGITFAEETVVVKEGSKSVVSNNATLAYRIEMQNDTQFDIDDYITEGWLYIGPGTGTNENFGPGIAIACATGTNNGYEAMIDERSAESPQIRENTDNTGRTNGTYQVADETWYLVNIYRDGGTDVKAEIYTEADAYDVTPTSTTTRAAETTYNTGYTGVFVYATVNSYIDAIWTRKRTEDEPAYGSWESEEEYQSDLSINVNESTTVTESNTPSIPTLHTNVYEESTATDYISASSYSYVEINTYDTTEVTDSETTNIKDRYWVGGTGNWSDTSHWSYTSGGTGGSSVPMPIDDVHIDVNSGFGSGGTITLDAVVDSYAVAHDFICDSGHTYTLTRNGGTSTGHGMWVYGSVVLDANMTFDAWFLALEDGTAPESKTITTNGVTITGLSIQTEETSDIYTLQDDLTMSRWFYHENGTFDANDKNLTATDYYFYSDGSYQATVYMGSGTWTANGSGELFQIDEYGGFVTFYPETSTIKLIGSSQMCYFYYGNADYQDLCNHTFNDIWFSGTFNRIEIYGNNTFNSFKVDAPNTISFQDGVTTTVTTFDVTGTSGNEVTIESEGNQMMVNQTGYTASLQVGGTLVVTDYQSFSVPTDGYIEYVYARLTRYGAVTDYSIRCTLYNDSGGSPGTLFATCETDVSASTINLTTGSTLASFYFDNEPMPAGNYWMKLEQIGGTLSDTNYCALMLQESADNTYSNGEMYYSIDGGALTLVSTLSAYDYCDATFGMLGSFQHKLSKSSGTVSCDYMNISSSNATGGATWIAGNNSVDSGDNDGWVFTLSVDVNDSTSVTDATSNELGDNNIYVYDSSSATDYNQLYVSSASIYVYDSSSLSESISTHKNSENAVLYDTSGVTDYSSLEVVTEIPWNDDFDDNNLNGTLWVESTNVGSLVVEQNQQLEVISSASVSGFVRSYGSFIPQNTQLIVRVTQHCTDGGFKLCPTVVVDHEWDVYSESNWYNYQLISGAISPSKKVNDGSATQIGGDASVSAPYWMRMKITEDTIYFDYSTQTAKPTESEWTNLSSETWGLGSDIDTAHYVYLTGYNTPTTGEPNYDSFYWENNDANTYVYDSTEVTENVSVYKNAEDLSAYDETSVIDYVSLSIPVLYIATSDATEATDSVLASITTLHISVEDSTAVSENTASVPYPLLISTYEESTVTDSVDVINESTTVYVSDSTTATDSVGASVPTIHINVNDSTSVTDGAEALVPTIYVSTYDESSVTDAPFFESLSISVYEQTTVTDYTDDDAPFTGIPPGIIFMWGGLATNIPAGWTKTTELHDNFIKGTANGVDPGDTGGDPTHTHSTAANHGHTMVNHTHTINITGLVGDHDHAGDSRETCSDHTNHAGNPFTSGAAVGGSLSSVSGTYSAVSNSPPYHTVIFVTSNGTVEIPDDMLGFVDSDGKDTGWEYCDGGSGTPNLVGKYLLGTSSSGNGGGTGGSTTNLHNLTHTHTVASHTHSGVVTGAADRYSQRDKSGTAHLRHQHTHTITLNSTTGTISGTAPALTLSETVEPAYTKLMAVQNQTGGADMPFGIIGLWLGDLDDIPHGWVLCDGSGNTVDMRGRYAKSTATIGEVGDTGGSNSHTHAANNHTHSAAAVHSHTASGLNHTLTTQQDGSDNSAYRISCYHSYTVNTRTPTYNNGSTSGTSSSNEPDYVTVAFIKLDTIESTQTVTAKGNIILGLAPEANDTTTVTESVTVLRSSEDIDVYDNPTATDSVTVSIPTLHINTFDSSGITDAIYIDKNSENISVSDSVSVDDSSDEHIPILHINVSDESTVTDMGGVGGYAQVEAKGNIKVLGVVRTVTAKANIMIETTQTVEAKAALVKIVYVTVQAKASIYRGPITNPTFGGITLPFPSEASITPLWEDAENLTFDGTTRRLVTARKYGYRFKWNTMLISDYNDLESVTNTLNYAEFVYAKWVQSRDGVYCLGTLSPRTLEHGVGDSAYLSSVILILVEVESRI